MEEEKVDKRDIHWNLCLTLSMHKSLQYIHSIILTQRDTLHLQPHTLFQQIKLEEHLESKNLLHEVADLKYICQYFIL